MLFTFMFILLSFRLRLYFHFRLKISNFLARNKWFKHVMYDSITEKFFRAPGPFTKPFERVFCRSLNNNNQ